MTGVEARREMPRFEVILVVVGSKQRFFVIDHLTKASRTPVNPFSREQADGLCALMATNAREKGEQLTVMRLVSALYEPPAKDKGTKLSPAETKRLRQTKNPAANSHN